MAIDFSIVPIWFIVLIPPDKFFLDILFQSTIATPGGVQQAVNPVLQLVCDDWIRDVKGAMVTWRPEAVLLFIILGYEVLDTSSMVIVSKIISLSQSLGLVCNYLAAYRTFYLVFSIAGFG